MKEFYSNFLACLKNAGKAPSFFSIGVFKRTGTPMIISKCCPYLAALQVVRFVEIDLPGIVEHDEVEPGRGRQHASRAEVDNQRVRLVRPAHPAAAILTQPAAQVAVVEAPLDRANEGITVGLARLAIARATVHHVVVVVVLRHRAEVHFGRLVRASARFLGVFLGASAGRQRLLLGALDAQVLKAAHIARRHDLVEAKVPERHDLDGLIGADKQTCPVQARVHMLRSRRTKARLVLLKAGLALLLLSVDGLRLTEVLAARHQLPKALAGVELGLELAAIERVTLRQGGEAGGRLWLAVG